MYVPIIKSTQSELIGIQHLDEETKSGVLPVFELTKSRKTRLVPEGDIYRSLERITEVYPDRPFILDLTGHEDLANSQIEHFFDYSGGYDNWCSFIEVLDNKNIYPAIQIVADEPERLGEITTQVRRLSKVSRKLALRIGVFDFDGNEISQFLEYILKGIDKSRIILILDAGYIKPMQSEAFAKEIIKQFNIINHKFLIQKPVIASSSFPRTVVMAGYGGDDFGIFPLEEVNLHRKLTDSLPGTDWVYSDYGSIHPLRYSTRGGSWVPRIDFPLAEQLYYYRYRRNKGGYTKAAAAVVGEKERYIPIECWGNKQILKAAAGAPKGKSPSFWISVRMNIHITRQLNRVLRLATQ